MDRKDIRKDDELGVLLAVSDSLGSRVEVEVEDSLVDKHLRNIHKDGERVVRNHMEEDTTVLPLETTMAAKYCLLLKVMATLRNLHDWMDP